MTSSSLLGWLQAPDSRRGIRFFEPGSRWRALPPLICGVERTRSWPVLPAVKIDAAGRKQALRLA